jgi:hypothetical protein
MPTFQDHCTYERTAIEAWFRRHDEDQQIRSPVTGEVLDSLELLPSIMIRNMAREYRDNRSSR